LQIRCIFVSESETKVSKILKKQKQYLPIDHYDQKSTAKLFTGWFKRMFQNGNIFLFK